MLLHIFSAAKDCFYTLGYDIKFIVWEEMGGNMGGVCLCSPVSLYLDLHVYKHINVMHSHPTTKWVFMLCACVHGMSLLLTGLHD